MHRNNPLDRSAGRAEHGFVALKKRSSKAEELVRTRSVRLMRSISRHFASLALGW